MVKYSRKVRASLSKHNILYNTKRVCNYLSITNEIKTCHNENIFGYRGKKIYCETHFLKEKKLALKHGESVESFIIGKPKSQNNIPTCTKKSCYTIGFKKINKKWFCQKHYIREKL
jgi:hypothetical protein